MKRDLPLSMLVQCEGYFCTASRGLTLGAGLAVLWLILGSDVRCACRRIWSRNISDTLVSG